MDEDIALDSDASQGFGNLKSRLFKKVKPHTVHNINENATDLKQECQQDGTTLLKQFLPHTVCMEIGENAYITFNDPLVADFNDHIPVKR